MGDLWVDQGSSMVSPWLAALTHGYAMGRPWIAPRLSGGKCLELPMSRLWVTHGWPMSW